jgi:hypothetical protein
MINYTEGASPSMLDFMIGLDTYGYRQLDYMIGPDEFEVPLPFRSLNPGRPTLRAWHLEREGRPGD